ncbi:MAG: hypothetical protein E6J90_38530 [Deltaproteobacteria bacterium]|nr:MAG: hypothetical protein E6J90_38530 [Deltaproteobacteria bacterium]
MSYLHCPRCSRAYNLATQPACPYCPVAAPVDAAADVAAAIEALVRAIARATPADHAAAVAGVGALAAPEPACDPGADLGNALMPHPRPPSRRAPWLALAFAVVDRVRPHAPMRLLRAVHAGVKAFAA